MQPRIRIKSELPVGTSKPSRISPHKVLRSWLINTVYHHVTIKCGSLGEFQMLTLLLKAKGEFVQLFCVGQERMQERSNKTVLKGEPWKNHSEDKESVLQSNLHWLIGSSVRLISHYLGTAVEVHRIKLQLIALNGRLILIRQSYWPYWICVCR